MLVVNDPEAEMPADAEKTALASPWDYDLLRISERRRDNAVTLARLLEPLAEYVEPLWPQLQPFEVPQTYPVLIRHVPRYDVYLAMNEAGYGVVALYHTMIDRLPRHEYPVSHQLADTILNLPVHQDVSAKDLENLVAELERTLKRLSDSTRSPS
jgi:dTDP-4-amino-4,6-dideoxygalactose transaminase